MELARNVSFKYNYSIKNILIWFVFNFQNFKYIAFQLSWKKYIMVCEYVFCLMNVINIC